ncbi:Uncharacterised protein [[Clostridium] sordellii]|uniref:hypothetical protein n=1 Tax=Paraclostridium sordellii TaxID=1505 RepID=UPI0005E029F1|nr:hypothetical protein [Paeniclostridium sordellii]CEN81997.1 Uncharacterised protein [[Clostridium] sordellii] [Paeniclostridium sordellii]CEO08430.1 Uncharacterised protein [[Clostridium] sordellii] [Paeniclostridium sordellii]
MKKIIGICLILCLLGANLILCLIGANFIIEANKEPISELKNAKFIKNKSTDLNIYEFTHELTHVFVKTNKNSVKMIAPTNEARTLASELSEKEIYGKGDIKTYRDIGYLIDKIKYGVIDKDILKLHDIVAQKSGDTNCKAKSLNVEVIDKIMKDYRFFDDKERECYNVQNSQ